MPSLQSIFISTATLASCLLGAFAVPVPTSGKSVSSLNVPLNGLVAPKGLTLRYVALGLGTQNYTCSDTSSAPVSIGAVASLYDASSLLANAPATIPSLAALAYSVSNSLGLPTLGHHWFSASGVPTFDLEAANPRAFLSAKKVASVPAPSSSIANSVPWLYLTDDGRGVSRNVKAVYRVETAGGGAPATCTKVGVITVRYAAEYWIYN